MKTKVIKILFAVGLLVLGFLILDFIFKLNLVRDILLPIFGVAGFCYIVKGYGESIENLRSSSVVIRDDKMKRKRKWSSVKNVRK